MENSRSRFLITLAQLLSHYHPSISFRQDIGVVVIRHPSLLASKLLPKFFGHRNYEIFCRQVLKPIIQLESHGIEFVEGDISPPMMECSEGARRLKAQMRLIRQMSLVGRMSSKLRARLDKLQEELDGLSVEELAERIFQLKKLHRDYERRLECYSDRLLIRQSNKKRQGSQQLLLQAPVPTSAFTERLIRFEC